MKKIILCSLTAVLFISVSAQSNKKMPPKKQVHKTTVRSNTKTNNQAATIVNNTSLSSTSHYSAKSNPASISIADRYTISDPTLKALSARAKGENINIGKSGIVGMPKRAYGFANGHLTLFTTGSTSSGTITGTGAVGTGSSLGSMGSVGPSIGLNGKSPYAGSTMWGNAINMQLRHADSAVRVGKKE